MESDRGVDYRNGGTKGNNHLIYDLGNFRYRSKTGGDVLKLNQRNNIAAGYLVRHGREQIPIVLKLPIILRPDIIRHEHDLKPKIPVTLQQPKPQQHLPVFKLAT